MDPQSFNRAQECWRSNEVALQTCLLPQSSRLYRGKLKLMPGVLDGEHLHLRSLNQQHLETLRGWRYETGFSSPCLPWPPTDDALEWLTRATDTSRTFLIETRTDVAERPEALGWCGLRGLDWKNRHANLIWASRRNALHLEAEALGVLVGFAFLELGLERVECETSPPDRDITALLERIGFKREAIKRESVRRGSRYVDSVVHAVLREDWMLQVIP
jgi:RimJ/RimL family protein N-acetyltransferase